MGLWVGAHLRTANVMYLRLEKLLWLQKKCTATDQYPVFYSVPKLFLNDATLVQHITMEPVSADQLTICSAVAPKSALCFLR